MPFKRRVDKTRDPAITPAMLTIFDRMRYASGRRWWDLHGELFDHYMAALSPHPRPWQWPVTQSPREALEGGERPEALALWRALDQASRAARAARRADAARNGRGRELPPAA